MLVTTGPEAPVSIETRQLTALLMLVGTSMGVTRFQPTVGNCVPALITSTMPPAPVPTRTPTRSRLPSWISKPLSASAILPVATAMWVGRAVRRTVFRCMYTVGSKPRTWHATWNGMSWGSKASMGAAPLRPASKLSQYSSTVLPMGVRAPRPVTTIRFMQETLERCGQQGR